MSTPTQRRGLFKIAVVGAPEIDDIRLKVIRTVSQNKFEESYFASQGVEITTSTYQVEDKTAKLIFLSINCGEFFNKLRLQYYHGANHVIIIYDLSVPESFHAVQDYHQETMKYCGEIPTTLIGLKTKKPVVTSDKAQKLADELNADFIEVNPHNPEKLVEELVAMAKQQMKHYGLI